MLRLGTFKVDCTPPEGFPIGFGVDGSAATIRDPLFMRGFVLEGGDPRCLIASLDYGGLMNSAHEELTGALAKAVGIEPERAIVHCVHQHDAPLLDFELSRYLGRETYPREWWKGVCAACASAAAACLPAAREVTAVGHRETRLHGYASNRRILGDDGKVRGMRFSRCASADLISQPVGVIDPMLRTLAFRGRDGTVLGSMSFYATHPQVANGRGMFSADAPGEAMRRVEERVGGHLHAYFSGAFGNVTAGKYSSYTDLEGNLATFGERLADGIVSNLNALVWETDQRLEWTLARFPFPRVEIDREMALAAIRDEKTPAGERLVKATILSCYDDSRNEHYPLKLVVIGANRVLYVPGEPFVEYQLFVQSLIPDEFVALAGNCGNSFLYLPLAEHFAQGGYEVTSYRWCTPAFEGRFKEAVSHLIRAPQ